MAKTYTDGSQSGLRKDDEDDTIESVAPIIVNNNCDTRISSFFEQIELLDVADQAFVREEFINICISRFLQHVPWASVIAILSRTYDSLIRHNVIKDPSIVQIVKQFSESEYFQMLFISKLKNFVEATELKKNHIIFGHYGNIKHISYNSKEAKFDLSATALQVMLIIIDSNINERHNLLF